MRKGLVGILVIVSIVFMFSLIACNVTDPIQTMKTPAVIEKVEVDNSELGVLSQLKEILPAEIELLKLTNLTEQKRDWLEIDLTGDGQAELLLGYRDNDEKIGVIILQKDEPSYKKLYMKTFDNYDYQLSFDKVMDIKTAQLINNKLSQVVVSYNFYASDYNSLSTHILGYDPEGKSN